MAPNTTHTSIWQKIINFTVCIFVLLTATKFAFTHIPFSPTYDYDVAYKAHTDTALDFIIHSAMIDTFAPRIERVINSSRVPENTKHSSNTEPSYNAILQYEATGSRSIQKAEEDGTLRMEKDVALAIFAVHTMILYVNEETERKNRGKGDELRMKNTMVSLFKYMKKAEEGVLKTKKREE